MLTQLLNLVTLTLMPGFIALAPFFVTTPFPVLLARLAGFEKGDHDTLLYEDATELFCSYRVDMIFLLQNKRRRALGGGLRPSGYVTATTGEACATATPILIPHSSGLVN